jgi:hypothetical protein
VFGIATPRWQPTLKRLLRDWRAATSFSGVVAGSSNQVEFYPDLGYVLVVLGNTDSGTEEIAAHVRDQLTSSVPAEPSQTIEK